jgi:AcrR family transcriptional regulator
VSRGGAPRGATRRVQLDRELIIQSAIELAASGAAITFRSLGAALGADPTAVYRHFRDKEELIRAVVDQLIVQTISRVDREASWREQLRSGAEMQLDNFAAHPSVGAEVGAIVTGGPGELSAIDWILSQFTRAGLPQDQAVRFYAAYSSYLLAASASLSTQMLRPSEGPTSWVGDQRAVDAMRYPAVAEAITELVSLTDREVYLMGFDVLLDAAEARARSRPRGRSSSA